jgi:hypothetical protein
MIKKDLIDDLDSMPCNTAAQVQVLTATPPVRLKTNLIGVDPGYSIILAMKTDVEWLAIKKCLHEGQGVVVRLMSSNETKAQIVAFRSNIQKVITICGRWLVLDYPNQMQEVALRKHSRIPIQIQSSILSKNSESLLSYGNLIDISIEGCAFLGETITNCEIGQSYQLQIQFAATQLSEPVPILLKSIIETDSSKKKYGFAFNKKDKRMTTFIQGVLFHHLSS